MGGINTSVGAKAGILSPPSPTNTSTDAAATSAQAQIKKYTFIASSLVAGFGSGALASIVCAPMDLIRTRMQVMGGLKLPKPPPLSLDTNVATKIPSSILSKKIPQIRAQGLNPGSGIGQGIVRSLREIVAVEGIRGTFRGLGATLLAVPAFWGMYFPLYEECKTRLGGWYEARYDREPGSPVLIHMTSAILSGAAADLVCNPMFVIRTRMQTESLHLLESKMASKDVSALMQRHLNIRETVKALHQEGGVPIFWRGLTASLLGLVHVAIQFPLYEFLKAEFRTINSNEKGQERPIDLLCASGISKVCASFVSYPHEVIRSRMMDARGAEAGRNVLKTVQEVVRTEGVGGLYCGLNVALIRVVPNCCITFLTYELFLRWSRDYLLE